MRKLIVLLFAVVSVAALTADGADELMLEGDIVDVAASNGSFSTLLAALGAADLVDTVRSEGPFTVFAPTDEAFAKLPEGTLDALLDDIPALTNILLYHVVPGYVTANDVVGLTSAQSASGNSFTVDASGGKVSVAGAHVVATDVTASNGVIHVIDSVMLPPTDDIVDIASRQSSFSTLVAALQAADLVDTLRGEGPFTVFAPTDEAFAKLPEGTVDALLGDIPALTDILLYHVVPGSVAADQVAGLSSASTALGKPFAVDVTSSGIYVDDAQVIGTDIFASNGVIHVIDSVIIPE